MLRFPAQVARLLKRNATLAFMHLRGQPAFAAMSALGMAISLAIMTATLSLASLGLDAAKTQVSGSGFDIVQVTFATRGAQTAHAVLQDPAMSGLVSAVRGVRSIAALSVGEAWVNDGEQTRITQILAGDTQAFRTLVPQLASGAQLGAQDAQVCLVDSDQEPGRLLRTVLPIGVQLRSVGRFYLRGAMTLAVDPARPVMWVQQWVFDALPNNNVRTLIQLRLRSTEYEDIELAVTQVRAFFHQRYPRLQTNVYTPWEALSKIKSTADTVSQVAILLGVVIAVLSAVAMSNAVLVSVKHRQLDIGVRLAIGARPSDIACQLVIETMALTVIGITTGWITALLVTRAWCIWSGWGWHPVYPALGLTAGVALLCGLGASLWPALAASRMQPASVLRQ
jgi:putative ABC transport system permease protein